MKQPLPPHSDRVILLSTRYQSLQLRRVTSSAKIISKEHIYCNHPTRISQYLKYFCNNLVQISYKDLERKYIISYKEKKQVSTNTNVNVKENDKKSNILIWIAIGGVLIALGTAIVIGVKKSRKN